MEKKDFEQRDMSNFLFNFLQNQRFDRWKKIDNILFRESFKQWKAADCSHEGIGQVVSFKEVELENRDLQQLQNFSGHNGFVKVRTQRKLHFLNHPSPMKKMLIEDLSGSVQQIVLTGCEFEIQFRSVQFIFCDFF